MHTRGQESWGKYMMAGRVLSHFTSWLWVSEAALHVIVSQGPRLQTVHLHMSLCDHPKKGKSARLTSHPLCGIRTKIKAQHCMWPRHLVKLGRP